MDTTMAIAATPRGGGALSERSPGGRPNNNNNNNNNNKRWFGMLHVFLIEGEAVTHSWNQYRRRRSQQTTYRRVACGVDLCGCEGPDACFGKADPYCTVDLEIGGGRTYRLGRSQTIDNNHNPKWNCEFSSLIDIDLEHSPFSMDFQSSASGPNLLIRVVDDDVGGESYSDILGQVLFPLKEATSRGRALRVSLSIKHPKAKPNVTSMSRVKIEFRWYPLLNPTEDIRNMTVPNVYFRRSHGNMIRLYHDAHVLEGEFFPIPCTTSTFADNYSCWNDMATAIEEAQHFIYIAGWSVNPAISLRRSYVEGEYPMTIGELLRKKSEEGVQVCILIWDDITSREGVSWLKDGLMATYDEYTRDFFKGTKVEVAVVKRVAGDDVGEVSELLKWTSFTHHQKIVLFDSPNPLDPVNGRRLVGAFVGGMDLTSGRYDTASHTMYDTLRTAHRGDFYNGCLVDATPDYGPREPWHDTHARILGPAAWDVLQTYIERVAKQAPKMISHTSGLIHDLRDRKKLRDGRKVLINQDHPQSWDVQVFRSLDSEAALFENSKWTSKFANSVFFAEKSVQQAYCYLIDRAKRFIYIENQYFLGSSQYWLAHSEVPCHNLVPFELTRRICRAIENGEMFTIYIAIPLFPEGAPGSASVQEILQWQYQTMCMMYHRIGVKLKEMRNTVNHPRDYLSFFFLGQREKSRSFTFNIPSLPADVAHAIQTMRHPIYIHSKLMIIDDDYLVIGSANINERSMSGGRDTEIAFGACQPAARCALIRKGTTTDPATGQENQYPTSGTAFGGMNNINSHQYEHRTPQGDIYAFRMQLWYEHLGCILPEFNYPAELKCMRLVNQLAQANWDAYVGELNMPLPYGHLCPYPVQVEPNGTVTPIPSHPNIPGFSCPVVGQRSTLLPASLTT